MPLVRGPENIVPNFNDILNIQAVQLEDWNLMRLIPALPDIFTGMQWLAARRLLKNSMDCGICQNPCTLNRYAQGIDGFRWRCNDCNFAASVRQGSLPYLRL